VLLAGLVVVLGIVGFRYFGHRHNGNTPQATTTHRVSHSPTPKTTPVAQTTPKHVELTLIARTGGLTWVRLTAPSGHVIFEGDFGAAVGMGKKTWTEANSPVTVEFGNPAGAVLYLNGHRQHYETTNPIKLFCTPTICAP
jgi:hypothetical protein